MDKCTWLSRVIAFLWLWFTFIHKRGAFVPTFVTCHLCCCVEGAVCASSGYVDVTLLTPKLHTTFTWPLTILPNLDLLTHFVETE